MDAGDRSDNRERQSIKIATWLAHDFISVAEEEEEEEDIAVVPLEERSSPDNWNQTQKVNKKSIKVYYQLLIYHFSTLCFSMAMPISPSSIECVAAGEVLKSGDLLWIEMV